MLKNSVLKTCLKPHPGLNRYDSFKFSFIKHPKKTDLHRFAIGSYWILMQCVLNIHPPMLFSAQCTSLHSIQRSSPPEHVFLMVSYDSHVPNLKPCGPCSFQQETCGVLCIIRHLHHLLRCDMVCQYLPMPSEITVCTELSSKKMFGLQISIA